MKKRSEPVIHPAPDDQGEIDVETTRNALAGLDGNVTAVARQLNVHSMRLRRFIDATPALRAEMAEIMECGVDEAIKILFKGLRDEHLGVKLRTAKEFLRFAGARKRSFGPLGATHELTSRAAEPLIITWLGPGTEKDARDPKLIEDGSSPLL
jgi:hypothetical protein